MKAFRVAEADLCAYLHPSESGNVPQALRRHLSSLILKYCVLLGCSTFALVGKLKSSPCGKFVTALQIKYDDSFDGVVLAHYDTKIKDRAAQLLNSLSPYFGVRLRTKLLLFSPKPGMFLEGKVTTIGLDFVRVVVLGISVATISFDDIREEFSYLEQGDERILHSKVHRRHVITVGSILRFLVKSVEETTGDISGSLMPHGTGCVRWLYSHQARNHEKQVNQKLESLDQDLQMKDDSCASRKHKSKRRRIDGDF